MRNRYVIVFTLLVLFLIAARLAAPPLISKLLNQVSVQICDSCAIKWQHTEISLSPAGIKLRDLSIDHGNERTTRIKATIPLLQANIALSALFGDTPELLRILVKNPKVIVIEGDQKTPTSRATDRHGKQHGVTIKEIVILNGDFTYQKNHTQNNKMISGRVHLHNIDAKAYPFKAGDQTATNAVKVQLDATLEDSGKVDLSLHFPDFSKRSLVNISLKIHSFDLRQSNAYFKNLESMKLSGTLSEGSSFVALNGNHLSAWARARYNGLKLEFLDTEDRSALSATVSTIITRKEIQSDKPDISGPKPRQTVQLDRKPNETHLSFIFRGLKEASLLEAKR